MLNDLLVLGLVPGTNFQITFNELLLLLDIGLVFILIYKYHLSSLNRLKSELYYLRLYFSADYGQQLKLPV